MNSALPALPGGIPECLDQAEENVTMVLFSNRGAYDPAELVQLAQGIRLLIAVCRLQAQEIRWQRERIEALEKGTQK